MEARYVVHKAGETEEGQAGPEGEASAREAPESWADNPEIAEKATENKNESDEDTRLLKKVVRPQCCCPETLRFKIFLSNVRIVNKNTACPS